MVDYKIIHKSPNLYIPIPIPFYIFTFMSISSKMALVLGNFNLCIESQPEYVPPQIITC